MIWSIPCSPSSRSHPAPRACETKSRGNHGHDRNRYKYRVKLWIHADVKRKQLLGTHEQLVLFNMPRELLERFGVSLL